MWWTRIKFLVKGKFTDYLLRENICQDCLITNEATNEWRLISRWIYNLFIRTASDHLMINCRWVEWTFLQPLKICADFSTSLLPSVRGLKYILISSVKFFVLTGPILFVTFKLTAVLLCVHLYALYLATHVIKSSWFLSFGYWPRYCEDVLIMSSNLFINPRENYHVYLKYVYFRLFSPSRILTLIVNCDWSFVQRISLRLEVLILPDDR